MNEDFRMRPLSKSEWFELDSPVGEDIGWRRGEKYRIERRVDENAEVTWYGIGTNWVRAADGTWSYLGTDPTVAPNPDGTYPEGRDIWISCNEPIYETLYRKLKK